MARRRVGIGLLILPLLMPVRSPAQEAPDIPPELQKTYGAFAEAMVNGDAAAAIEFYAEDAVVLVDHEHVYRGRQAIRDGFLAEYLEVASQQPDEEGPGTDIGVDRMVVGEGVVTLVGRYTSPSIAAGVYSNTWERQADGSWKLAASILTFEGEDPSSEQVVVHTTLRPPNQDVYLVEGPGAEPRRLTDHPALDYNATFSPDGRWLVFTSDRGGSPDLYALDLDEDGAGPVRLTRSPALDDAADVSPDGERLVFVSTRDGNADVFVMPFAPGDTTAEASAEKLTDNAADDFNPAFSPDGSRIAWVRRTGAVRPPDLLLMETFVMESDGSGARPVAGDGMIAGAPAWSVDGEALYVHGIFHGGSMERLMRRHGAGWTSRIWRVPLSDGDPVPVTAADTFLALSPAATPGGRVSFFRGRRPPSREAPLYRRTGAVHTVDPDGSDLRPAYDATRLPLCLAPAYDGDGRLACHGPGSTEGMPIMANDRPYVRPGTHRRVSLPDREVRVMGIRGYFPDFLPEGRLVYGEWLNDEADMAEYGMPPLVTSRLDGADRRVVYHRENRQPWAPSACDDGSWIAFNEGPTFAPTDEDVDIWKVRPDGRGAVNLTPDSDANDAFPAWSPDCRTIVFRSGRDGDKEIYRMDADGGNVRRLTHREGVETVPDVSPDGEWIAFATDRDGAGMKIWIEPLDGGGGRFLEPDRAGTPGIDMHPRFSPDGRWVAFVSDRGGMADEFLLTGDPQPYGEIWAVPVDGGEAVRITNDRWEDGLPRWGSSVRR